MRLTIGRFLFLTGLLLVVLTVLSTSIELFQWLHWGPVVFNDHIAASEAIYFTLGIILIGLSELDWS